jgi:hypothetical protein
MTGRHRGQVKDALDRLLVEYDAQNRGWKLPG